MIINLGDIIENTAYDQFYDEHVFYFSLASLSHALEQHNLTIVDASPQPVHGGSMRYVIARNGARQVSPAVDQLRTRESSLGLSQESTFEALQERIDRSRNQLTSLLKDLKRDGKRVVGYGVIESPVSGRLWQHSVTSGGLSARAADFASPFFNGAATDMNAI